MKMNGFKVIFLAVVCSIWSRNVSAQESDSSKVVTMLGETATLPCSALDHSLEVTWRRANEPSPLTVGLTTFTADNRIHVSHPSDAQWELVIADVMLNDSGVYECHSINGYSSMRVMVGLEVRESDSAKVVTMLGETATLPCSVSDQRSQVIWRRANEPSPLTVGLTTFTADNRIHVSHPSDAQWELVIADVMLNDSGVYECHSINGQSSRRVMVELEVRAAPALRGGEATVLKARGADMTLTCQATGNPLPHIRWITPDGHILGSDSRVDDKRYTTTRVEAELFKVTTELHVDNLEADDFGFYKCDAVNKDGSQRRYVKVSRGGR